MKEDPQVSCWTFFMRARAAGEGSLSDMVRAGRGGKEKERKTTARKGSQERRNTPYLFIFGDKGGTSQPGTEARIFQVTLNGNHWLPDQGWVRIACGEKCPVMTSQEHS